MRAAIPIINALSDASHPCQAMADMMTIEELKGTARRPEARLRRRRQQRRAVAGRGLGPAGRRIRAVPARRATSSPRTSAPGSRNGSPRSPLRSSTIPARPSLGADIVYTDVWASMGQEHEAEQRREAFAPYQVDDALLAPARHDVDLPPLPPRPPRRGGDLERPRRPAQPGHPPGGQPAPFPDGAAGLAARRVHRLRRCEGVDSGERISESKDAIDLLQTAIRFALILRIRFSFSHPLTESVHPGGMPHVRRDGRTPEQLRPVTIERGYVRNSPGSVLYRAGATLVLATAQVSETVPPFLEGKGRRLADGRVRDAAGEHARAACRAARTAARPRSSG